MALDEAGPSSINFKDVGSHSRRELVKYCAVNESHNVINGGAYLGKWPQTLFQSLRHICIFEPFKIFTKSHAGRGVTERVELGGPESNNLF